jgi:hypothetical protein
MPVLLPSPVFRWFVPAQNGTGLVPAAGYKAKFYEAGTTTPKAIYDVDGTVYPSPSNTATLNSEGYAGIKLGTGNYKLVVTTSADAPVYTQDNIGGDNTFGTGFVATVMESEDSEGLAAANTSANQFVWCAGYWQIGDGGHGFFWNETSIAPDDGGYVIASTYDSNKRWYRVPDEDDAVRAASFGYIGTIEENFADELLAAASYCSSFNKTLRIGPGDAATISDGGSEIHIYAPQIILEPGSMLTVEAPTTGIMLHGIVTGTPEQHFTATTAKLANTQISNMPEWWGASVGSDNTAAFAKWFAALDSGQGAFILPPGVWPYADTTSFPYPTLPFIRYGTIDATTGSDIPPGEYWPAASQIRVNQLLLAGGATLTSSGANAALVGNLDITGTASATGAITSTTGGISSQTASVSAATDVAAGTGAAEGYLTGKAGLSPVRFRAPGTTYAYNGSAATTSGTSETDLLSHTIEADTLVSGGDRLTIIAGGTMVTAASGINRRIRIALGAQIVFDATIENNGGGTTTLTVWNLRLDLWYGASTTVRAYGTLNTNFKNTSSGTGQSCVASGVFGSADWESDALLKFMGTASTSGSISQDAFSIEYWPAP